MIAQNSDLDAECHLANNLLKRIGPVDTVYTICPYNTILHLNML